MSTDTVTVAGWVGMLSVDVVDGNGEGVAGEPVEVVYRLPDGTRSRTQSLTDAGGRAHLVDQLPVAPQSVTLIAAGEEVGPIEPSHRSAYVIET